MILQKEQQLFCLKHSNTIYTIYIYNIFFSILYGDLKEDDKEFISDAWSRPKLRWDTWILQKGKIHVYFTIRDLRNTV